MSLELETLDQLLGGDMTLGALRSLYPDDLSFAHSIHALLLCGDVRLLASAAEVPPWRWRDLFTEGCWSNEQLDLRLELTDQGAQRIA